ncbi:MAG: PhzF family phenazine biosynthesis protein [Clostridiales bacterium]|nr:PhzF family phenazine biosynthesis protein [Clostridiales bacterium]
MKFYIVDAFTTELFGGNPAGVVLLGDRDFSEIPDEVMIKTAAELRYSETVFIKQEAPDRFHFRYFTPVEEVDLCGHATMAAFRVLVEEGLVSPGNQYALKTLAGELTVETAEGETFMEMAEPRTLRVFEEGPETEELYEAMGLSPEDGIPGWLPEIISTGLPDILLPVQDPDTLNSMVMDREKLCELSRRYEVIGLHAFAPGGELGFNMFWAPCTAFCRNFAPACGIDEEAATGTANGGLTYYLWKKDMIAAGGKNNFLQGESMGRPSWVRSLLSLDEESSPVIRIGGSAAILASGNIHL